MAIEKRPVRQATGAQKRPTGSQRVLAQPSSGGTRQSRAAAPAAKNNQALIIGGAVGGVVVLALIGMFVMGGGDTGKVSEKKPAGKTEPEKRPVDVRELVRTGTLKADEGYGIIQGCKSDLENADRLGDAQKDSLKKKLQQGVDLIKTGMSMLDEATTKSGEPQGNVRREWVEARKLANNFMANLGR